MEQTLDEVARLVMHGEAWKIDRDLTDEDLQDLKDFYDITEDDL